MRWRSGTPTDADADVDAEVAAWRLTGEPSGPICRRAIMDHLAGRPTDYLPEAADECWRYWASLLDGAIPNVRHIITHQGCQTCALLADLAKELNVPPAYDERAVQRRLDEAADGVDLEAHLVAEGRASWIVLGPDGKPRVENHPNT